MEPRADWRRFEKLQFARAVAEIIDRGARGKSFDRLVLVAPPKTLGDLRAALGSSSQSAIYGELAKDLTKVPIRDLPAHLRNVLVI